MLNCFRLTDLYRTRPGVLRDRIQFFEITEKEDELIMRDVLEEYYAKRDAEQIQMYQRMLEEANQKVFKITEEYALALLQLGASLQEISEKTQLPIERIQKLAQEQEDKH